jgi:hypothetical protein
MASAGKYNSVPVAMPCPTMASPDYAAGKETLVSVAIDRSPLTAYNMVPEANVLIPGGGGVTFGYITDDAIAKLLQ